MSMYRRWCAKGKPYKWLSDLLYSPILLACEILQASPKPGLGCWGGWLRGWFFEFLGRWKLSSPMGEETFAGDSRCEARKCTRQCDALQCISGHCMQPVASHKMSFFQMHTSVLEEVLLSSPFQHLPWISNTRPWYLETGCPTMRYQFPQAALPNSGDSWGLTLC